jgi:hypothetical protein
VTGMKVTAVAVLWIAGAIATAAAAEDRMKVDRNFLIYDLSESSGLPEDEQTILPEDRLLLAELLMDHPDVDTFVVSGGGGLSWPAEEMAIKIESFGLRTVARHSCISACTTMFLGGVERSMEPGARLGFHRGAQSADFLRELYRGAQGDHGWVDEFAFAAYLYERGEVAARNYIEFLVRRGVSIDFALRTLTYSSDDIWFPTPEELFEHGVLTLRAETKQEVVSAP